MFRLLKFFSIIFNQENNELFWLDIAEIKITE